MLNIFSSTKATAVDDSLPSEDTLQQVVECSVKDSDGKSHLLSSLMNSHERTIVILVRHNHCGMCMEYIRACSQNKVLQSTTTASKVQVLVIGHGSHEGISRYKELSECTFEMYSDQDKHIYSLLGLTRRFLGNTEETKRASYIPQGQSTLSLTLHSTYNMITSGSLSYKGGDVALLGGEFVFERDSSCIFCHRMKDTQDHTKVEELARYVDLESKS